jgi:hypothetical protein
LNKKFEVKEEESWNFKDELKKNIIK